VGLATPASGAKAAVIAELLEVLPHDPAVACVPVVLSRFGQLFLDVHPAMPNACRWAKHPTKTRLKFGDPSLNAWNKDRMPPVVPTLATGRKTD